MNADDESDATDETGSFDESRALRYLSESHLPSLPAVGARVGAYRIEATLGAGGMGVVYLAVDPSTQREVAIKFPLLDPELGDDQRGRFLREALAAGSLQHPSIVGVVDQGDWNGLPYLVMERLCGSSLQRVIEELRAGTRERSPAGLERPGARSFEDAAVILVGEVLDGLSFAHSKGVLHRDIKPSNVFLVSDGTLRIVDFGVAQLASAARMTGTGAAVGTYGYMAPEIVDGSSAGSASSDVYSAAMLAYELLTLVPAVPRLHAGDSSYLRSERIVAAHRREPRVPAALAGILERGYAGHPTRRFSSADAFLEQLNRFLDRSAVLPRPASGLRRSWRRIVQRPTLAMLAAVLAVVALGWSRTAFEAQASGSELRRVESAELFVQALYDEYLDAPEGQGYSPRVQGRTEALEKLKRCMGLGWNGVEALAHQCVLLLEMHRYDELRPKLEKLERLGPGLRTPEWIRYCLDHAADDRHVMHVHGTLSIDAMASPMDRYYWLRSCQRSQDAPMMSELAASLEESPLYGASAHLLLAMHASTGREQDPTRAAQHYAAASAMGIGHPVLEANYALALFRSWGEKRSSELPRLMESGQADLAEGLRHAKRAIELRPSWSAGYVNAAQILGGGFGDHSQAREYMELGLQNCARNSRLLDNLAASLLGLATTESVGDEALEALFQRAYEAAMEAMSLSPDGERGLVNGAIAATNLGLGAEARALAERCLKSTSGAVRNTGRAVLKALAESGN